MKYLIVANWKMNPASYAEAKTLFDMTRKAAEAAKNVSLIVAPPAIFLRPLRAGYKGRSIAFAAQNAHAERTGSYTGEVSLSQIKDARATHVVIGHAERRAMGETDDDVRAKTTAALAQGMVPIVCVGEKSRNSDGDFYVRVREQLTAALRDVPPAKISRILVAYEPVWAIGAEKPMQARDMQAMAIFIRKTIVGTHGEGGMRVKILYGGSIDETNAGEMLRGGDVQGLLVGRASAAPFKIKALIEAVDEA